jgi:hypothetical protein
MVSFGDYDDEDYETEDHYDFEILRLANENGKFAIPFNYEINKGKKDYTGLVQAIERGIDNNWFFLIDISPLMWDPSRIYRIYRLTPEGKSRKLQLEN